MSNESVKEKTTQSRRVMMAMVWEEKGHRVGVARYAREAGWFMNHAIPGMEQRLEDWKPDGLITQLHGNARKFVNTVKNMTVPIVELSNYLPKLHVARVWPDWYQAGQMAADHFIEREFQNLAYIGHRSGSEYHTRSYLRGYSDRAEESGHTIHTIFIDELTTDSNLKSHQYLRDETSAGYRNWFSAHIDDIPKPLGIFVSDLAYCIDLVEGCLEAGIKIPEDVAVITLADYPIESELTVIPLTSISMDYEKQGYEAAKLLDLLMDNGQMPNEPVYVSPKPIIARESTDIQAVSDRDVAVVLGYIKHNLHSNSLSVAEIIRETGIPQGKLYYAFMKHIGRPLADHITFLRLEKAKELLAGTNMKANEIGQTCGFTDLKHFRRSLKRFTGLGPREYKKSLLSVGKK